jgi:hypothetical protein
VLNVIETNVIHEEIPDANVGISIKDFMKKKKYKEA